MQKPFQKNDLCIKINYNMNNSLGLSALRAVMKKNLIDVYIIPSSDPHQSEYVTDHWKTREWISCFNGSAGTVVVTADHAGLWTDSRYFLQAEEQLKEGEFELHKIFDRTTANYILWINQHFDKTVTVGIDGWLFSKSQEKTFRKNLSANGHKLVTHIDLIEPIWENRPVLPQNEAFLVDAKFAGKSAKDKIAEIRSHLSKHKVHSILLSSLDEIAWTLNIRSSDIEFNPLVISYLLIGKTKSILFIDKEKIIQLENHLNEAGIEVLPYSHAKAYLASYSEGEILIDPNTCNITLFDSIEQSLIKTNPSIVYKLKGIKNDIEIANIKHSMVKDGIALCHAFYWLENNIASKKITEYIFSNKLSECRNAQADYFGESFPPIVGYEANGAIIHYRPEQETSKTILPASILLCDSGGQYFDGTTDITRTLALGEITESQKLSYTSVLKGHIDLAMAKFPEGTTGVQLDILARKHLWDDGLNYLHGTGHGIGFFLNVHEGPQGLTAGPSPKGNAKILPGMVTSNEPGYYEDGKYGIRIENVVVCKQSDHPGFLEFETITLYPIDKKLINKENMGSKHIEWLNKYHEQVWAKLSPLLPESLQKWLEPQCSPL